MRPLVVGEAPSRTSDPAKPLSGRSGARLAGIAGVDRLESAFDLVNVLDRWPGRVGKGSRFPIRKARLAAAKLDLDGRVVLFLGKRAATAFGIVGREFLEWFEHGGARAVIVPHPSRVNRWWNDPSNVARATSVIRSTIDERRHDGRGSEDDNEEAA